jgi:hypothetical protein
VCDGLLIKVWCSQGKMPRHYVASFVKMMAFDYFIYLRCKSQPIVEAINKSSLASILIVNLKWITIVHKPSRTERATLENVHSLAMALAVG